MEEQNHIGNYIREKLRNKKVTNKEAANFLNLAETTIEKIFPLEDIYISRLIKFCALIGDDIIKDFYYTKEPLKSFKENELKEWLGKIKDLESTLENKLTIITKQEEHIATQNKLIAKLEEEIERLRRGG